MLSSRFIDVDVVHVMFMWSIVVFRWLCVTDSCSCHHLHWQSHWRVRSRGRPLTYLVASSCGLRCLRCACQVLCLCSVRVSVCVRIEINVCILVCAWCAADGLIWAASVCWRTCCCLLVHVLVFIAECLWARSFLCLLNCTHSRTFHQQTRTSGTKPEHPEPNQTHQNQTGNSEPS